MRRFNVTASLGLSSTAGPSNAGYPFELVTGANASCDVYELGIEQDGTAAPQDGTWVAFLGQVTAATAGSALTPTPLDPNEGAANTSANASPTGITLALTLPVSLLTVGGNTRVTMRWVALEPDAVIHQKAGLTTATGVVLGTYQTTGLSNTSLRSELFFRE